MLNDGQCRTPDVQRHTVWVQRCEGAKVQVCEIFSRGTKSEAIFFSRCKLEREIFSRGAKSDAGYFLAVPPVAERLSLWGHRGVGAPLVNLFNICLKYFQFTFLFSTSLLSPLGGLII